MSPPDQIFKGIHIKDNLAFVFSGVEDPSPLLRWRDANAVSQNCRDRCVQKLRESADKDGLDLSWWVNPKKLEGWYTIMFYKKSYTSWVIDEFVFYDLNKYIGKLVMNWMIADGIDDRWRHVPRDWRNSCKTWTKRSFRRKKRSTGKEQRSIKGIIWNYT